MTPLLVIVAFAAIGAAIIALAVAHQRQRRGRASYIDSYAFPPGLRQRVARKYPHLTGADLDLVFDALREYFHLCRKAGPRLLAMPSQVVDIAWHEFILFTRNYQHFCTRALGRYLHHTPTEAMPTPTSASAAIKRTWQLACRRAGIDPLAASALPPLFAIDQRLAIADGFHYALDCRALAAAGASSMTYCASAIGCGGGCAGGCAGDGCSGEGDGGCGGGGGD